MLSENKNYFSKVLVKSKKMQQFFINFENEFSMVLKNEFKNNFDQIDLFVKYPSIRSTSVDRYHNYTSQKNPFIPREILKVMNEDQKSPREGKYNYSLEK